MKIKKSSVTLLLSFLPTIALPVTAFAQSVEQRPVSAEAKKAERASVNFQSVLERLSRRSRCAIVTEGWPLDDETDSTGIASLLDERKREIRPGEITQIAERFDYSVERYRNILLFRKRYSRPDDLPAVTLEECRESVRDLQTVLAPFCLNRKSGAVSTDPTIKQLIKSFTPEQLTALTDSQRGLALTNLSSAQRAATWHLALHYYVGGSERAVRAAQHHLTHATKNEVSIGWPERYPHRVLGYTFPSSEGSGNSFRPLRLEQGQFSLDGISFFPSTSQPEIKTDKNQARTHPMPVSSLRELAEAHKAIIDDSLAAKPVFLIGSEYATSDEILRSLTDLFGLRLSKSPDNTLRITRRKARPAPSPLDIQAGILEALPLPLLRALSAGSAQTAPASSASARPAAFSKFLEKAQASPSGASALEHFQKRQIAAQHRDAIRTAAASHVRQAFQERIERERRPLPERVPIKEFTPETQTAFALLVMSDCLRDMEALFEPAPPYIREFDTVVLVGGLSNATDGNRLFSLSLYQRTAEGSVLQNGPGFRQVQYDKLDSALYQ